MFKYTCFLMILTGMALTGCHSSLIAKQSAATTDDFITYGRSQSYYLQLNKKPVAIEGSHITVFNRLQFYPFAVSAVEKIESQEEMDCTAHKIRTLQEQTYSPQGKIIATRTLTRWISPAAHSEAEDEYQLACRMFKKF